MSFLAAEMIEGVHLSKAISRPDFIKSMSSSPFLPLPPGFEILSKTSSDDVLHLEVVSARRRSRCPLCLHPTVCIHSHYTHLVADVPCGGLQVQLVLQVHKFFCDTPECPDETIPI